MGVIGWRMDRIRQMHHGVRVNKSKVVKLKVQPVFIKARTMDLVIIIITVKDISTMIMTRMTRTVKRALKRTVKMTLKMIVIWPKPYREFNFNHFKLCHYILFCLVEILSALLCTILFVVVL